ncbi:MAG: hypothetical protein K8R57_03090 [Verrucomicrobia bacterium]|nr:hypothetical protein [Verrucomicrobiota bacterium]
MPELLALADGGWAGILAALFVAACAEAEGYRCKRNDRRDLGDGHNKFASFVSWLPPSKLIHPLLLSSIGEMFFSFDN